MRRLLLASLMLYTACGFSHGSLGPSEAGVVGDATDAPMIDAMVDGPAPLCYGKAPFTVCLTAEPMQALTLAGSIETTACTYNAGAAQGEIITANGTSLCVIAGATISMTGISVGTSGDRPLVLIASGDLTVPMGTRLDASSATNNVVGVPTGPGFDPPECGAPPTGGTDSNGGGGGAGGTFGTRGAAGGNGGGANGGTATPVPSAVTTLRGGCPGGNGSPGDTIAAEGGPGGGAVALYSHATLHLDGTVTASGAGGVGGHTSRGGGGGGGSGGMILLHAQTIAIGASAAIMANGGGGGGGAGNSGNGDNGQDASSLTNPALGGQTTNGGATLGGNGGTKGAPPTSPGTSGAGGGGGGGGLGIIRVLSGQSVNNARFSPNPS